MEPKREVEQWIQKARASWWEDGLAEIVSGLGLTFLGALGLWKERIPASSRGFWDFLWLFLLLTISLGTPYLVRWLKRRWIWPKTGYAHPLGRRWDPRSVLQFLGLLLLVGVATFLSPPVLSGILAGLFLFLILYHIARFSGLWRFLFIGLTILALSLIMGALALPLPQAILSLLSATGVLLLISGIHTWIRFRHSLKEAHDG